MNVYDFDNTLYDGESGLQFFVFYLRKNPALLRYLPRAAVGILNYKRGLVTLDQVAERYAAQMKPFFESIKDIPGDMREFWDKHEHSIRPFYKALQRPDDLVISAGPEQSLREICGRLGVRHYIGSVINEDTRTFEFICFRENKVRAFRERWPGQGIDDFYTDSMNDKPLMDLAQRVFMVGKKGIERIK
ncbi:MAG: haloacid dehalogenase-like hydrolase [Firmicutes bacterium]|nr:haloacid dehalogenase-like hydrolase [Bacillota bacterium]